MMLSRLRKRSMQTDKTASRLHLGCGTIYFRGWINLDLDSPIADLHHDLRQPLPFADNTISAIYSEHVIEHLTSAEGVFALSECRRVLKPNGVVRIATPDLTYLLMRYFFLWRSQDWITTFGYQHLKTRAEMVNLSFREWGHQHLYDYEELVRRFREAGFTRIARRKLNWSPYPVLRGRESRKDSKLIVEAVKEDG